MMSAERSGVMEMGILMALAAFGDIHYSGGLRFMIDTSARIDGCLSIGNGIGRNFLHLDGK